MPEYCGECGLKEGSYCYFKKPPYNFNDFNILKGRHPDCLLVEIVTCKDCKYREKVHPHWLSNKKAKVYFCTLQSDEYCYEVEDDHFCADGERRE